MPAAALADSQYLGGTGGVSKTADKEDATAPLGDSEPARVQNPPGHAIPEVDQPPEYDTEVGARRGSAGNESGNIFNDEPSWPQVAQHSLEFKPQTATLAGKATPVAGHTDVLAGEAAVHEIRTVGVVSPGRSRCSKPFSVRASRELLQVSASSAPCSRVHLANVTQPLRVGEVTLEDGQAVGVAFGLQQGLDAGALEAEFEAAHS